MPKPYSEDLRLKALSLIDEGKKVLEVVELLKISKSCLYDWKKIRQERGTVRPKTGYQKGHSPTFKDMNVFENFVNQNQGMTGKEMAQKWGNVSSKTMCKWICRIGYTRKKKFSCS